LRTASRLANTPEAIKFVALPTRPVRPEAGEAAVVPAYFGSIPDYDGGDEGVRLAGVSPGSPAAIAGLREGDIIIRFAGARIQNIEDFMTQLSAQKPGDHVEIVVLRSGAPVTAKATLARRG
jgi:S1-C subfamily serine protease